MPWCDFYVHTESDYYLERISFDKDFWAVIKHKLDMFFYNYYLPLFVTETDCALCISDVGVT